MVVSPTVDVSVMVISDAVDSLLNSVIVEVVMTDVVSSIDVVGSVVNVVLLLLVVWLCL